jgi:formylglycine-generating enzyme required for sulfatase activity
VFRGGNWRIPAWNLRSAYRNFIEPGSRSSYYGFRVLLAPGQP